MQSSANLKTSLPLFLTNNLNPFYAKSIPHLHTKKEVLPETFLEKIKKALKNTHRKKSSY
jgi:hypothetical protein